MTGGCAPATGGCAQPGTQHENAGGACPAWETFNGLAIVRDQIVFFERQIGK